MDQIVNKILKYMEVGFSEEAVMEAMKDQFAGDQDKYFALVKKTFSKAYASLDEEDRKKLDKLRKVVKNQQKFDEMQVVADQVKSRAENNTTVFSQKEKLNQAVKFVSMNMGIPVKYVRDYTKIVYPCFYDEFYNNRFMNQEYLKSMAKSIIAKGIKKYEASKMFGYNKMMKYLEEFEPELFEELNNHFVSVVPAKSTFTNWDFVETDNIYNNIGLLEEIIYTFRVPFKVICEFLKFNKIFLKQNSIQEPDFIETIKKQANNRVAVEWYLAEMSDYMDPSKYDDYVNYRIKKFNAFAVKFNLLKDDFETLQKFIKSETSINLTSVNQKVGAQTYNRPYNFEHKDIKTILEFMYKYGLGELAIQNILGIPRPSRSKWAESFTPENFEEEMLLNGFNKLTDCKNDMSYAYRVGRK